VKSRAVHHAVPTRIGFGERLDQALGCQPCVVGCAAA
jgi:hypothetical protein